MYTKDEMLTQALLTIGFGLIIGSLFSIAVSLSRISTATVSRDFNNDGKVDIIDLSIMADEIRVHNENK